jgi:hypothetical protein
MIDRAPLLPEAALIEEFTALLAGSHENGRLAQSVLRAAAAL